MGLYGKDYFIDDNREAVNEFGLIELVLVIVTAYIAFIGFIVVSIIKSTKDAKKIINLIKNSPEAQRKLKELFESIQKYYLSSTKISKYKKYLKKGDFKPNYAVVKYKGKENLQINLSLFTVDVEKIFKDIYKVDMEKYTEKYHEEKTVDECKPAPEFKNYLKDMEKVIEEEFIPVQEKLKKVSVYMVPMTPLEDCQDWDDVEYFYDSYYAGGEKCIIGLTIKLSENDLDKKNIPTMNEEEK